MTKELDRRFRHVGRIKRSWGTTHKPTIRLMESMMSGLFERGRLDILRGIQSGEYSPLQVYDAYRTNDLERLPTAATLAPLKESMEKWIAKKECSGSHRLSLSQSLRHLTAGSGANCSVGLLPARLSILRESLAGKHPRSFNLARAAAQAFVKSTLKRSHPIYAAILDIELLPVTPQRSKHPATPMELARLTKKMKPQHADIAWGMATTGMGPGEFWGKWEMNLNHIAIHGTKRKGRERIVPLVIPISRPMVLYPAFRRALEAAGDMRPYDLRRTYANWLEAANIPASRAQQYMGHKPASMTDLYRWHEVLPYINADAAKLIDHVALGATENTRLKLGRKA